MGAGPNPVVDLKLEERQTLTRPVGIQQRHEPGSYPHMRPGILTAGESAVLQATLYASLFHFPITPEEVAYAAPEANLAPGAVERIYRESPVLQRLLDFSSGYFFPRGRQAFVRLRRLRKRHSRRYLWRHRRACRAIAALPGVRMAALSGSAAHLNIGRRGDIDFFIVTRGPRVWTVTVTALLLAKLFRSRPAVCLNYVISDRRLSLEHTDRFSANQLIHLKPLTGAATFRTLLNVNAFIREHYPRAARLAPAAADWTSPLTPTGRFTVFKRPLERLLSTWVGDWLERLCRNLYRRYLLRRCPDWRSPEEVRLDKEVLKLHTESHRREVERRFQAALEAGYARVARASSP